MKILSRSHQNNNQNPNFTAYVKGPPEFWRLAKYGPLIKDTNFINGDYKNALETIANVCQRYVVKVRMKLFKKEVASAKIIKNFDGYEETPIPIDPKNAAPANFLVWLARKLPEYEQTSDLIDNLNLDHLRTK